MRPLLTSAGPPAPLLARGRARAARASARRRRPGRTSPYRRGTVSRLWLSTSGRAARTRRQGGGAVAKVGHQDLDARPAGSASRSAVDRGRVVRRAAVGQVVARDAGHDHVATGRDGRRPRPRAAARRRRARAGRTGDATDRRRSRSARVQASPRMRKVAVPAAKHSPRLGQRAASQTVCRSSSSSSAAPVARGTGQRRSRHAARAARPACLTAVACRGHRALAASHSVCMPRPTAPRAASPTASASVGWAWIVLGHVVEGQAGPRRQHELVHELGHVRADQAGADHAAVVGARDDADVAVALTLDHGFRVTVETYLRHHDGQVLGLGLVFARAEARHLGVAEDAVGHEAPVDRDAGRRAPRSRPRRRPAGRPSGPAAAVRRRRRRRTRRRARCAACRRSPRSRCSSSSTPASSKPMPRLTGERPTLTSTSAAATVEPSARARPTCVAVRQRRAARRGS